MIFGLIKDVIEDLQDAYTITPVLTYKDLPSSCKVLLVKDFSFLLNAPIGKIMEIVRREKGGEDNYYEILRMCEHLWNINRGKFKKSDIDIINKIVLKKYFNS